MRTSPDFGRSFPLSGSDELKSVWGYMVMYRLYTNCITPDGELSSSPLTRLLEVGSLRTLYEAIHMEDLKRLELGVIEKSMRSLLKNFNSLSKFADDTDSIIPVISALVRNPQVRDYLSSWEEFKLLFMSPFIVGQTAIKNSLKELGSSNLLSRASGLMGVAVTSGNFREVLTTLISGGISFLTNSQTRDLLDAGKIRKGPLSLYSYKNLSPFLDPLNRDLKQVKGQQTRISSSKRRVSIRNSIIRLSIKKLFGKRVNK